MKNDELQLMNVKGPSTTEEWLNVIALNYDSSLKEIEQHRKVIRCCLRAFQKHLNIVETRTIKPAAKRLGSGLL